MKLFLDYTYKLDCENKINYFDIKNVVDIEDDKIPESNYIDINTSKYKQISLPNNTIQNT